MNGESNNKRGAGFNLIPIFIIVIIIAVAVIIYNTGAFSEKSVRTIIESENNSNYQMMNYNGSIMMLNYDTVSFVSKNGEKKGEFENKMTAPHTDISGDYILLYDKNSYGIRLYNGDRQLYSYESDMRIKTAHVNNSGYVVVITDETGYNARISVINQKGNVEYEWKIGDVFVVDADISSNNKMVAVIAIDTQSGKIVENVILADITQEKEVSRIKNDGAMPLAVSFNGSEGYVVVSDSRMCGYNTRGEEKWSRSYESRLLKAFVIEERGNIVLALGGIKNNTIVQAYTKNGSKSGEYVTESEIKSLDANGRYISVYESNKVSVINFSGKLVDRYDVKKDYKKLIVLDRKNIVLMRMGGIDLLKL